MWRVDTDKSPKQSRVYFSGMILRRRTVGYNRLCILWTSRSTRHRSEPSLDTSVPASGSTCTFYTLLWPMLKVGKFINLFFTKQLAWKMAVIGEFISSVHNLRLFALPSLWFSRYYCISQNINNNLEQCNFLLFLLENWET